jgi:hypothetical protein
VDRNRATVSGMRTLLALVVAALLVACGDQNIGESGPDPITDSGNTDNPPAADVVLDVCGPHDATNWAVASGTITNHSSGTSDYVVTVEFVDPAGVRYTTGSFAAQAVAADQTIEWEGLGLEEFRQGTTCDLVEVQRWAS